MNGKKPFFLIVLLAGAILLCCNVFVQSRLDESIKKNKLIDEQFVEGAPPLVAFTTVALGGFRGIIADFLWFRAMALQDEGKYFDVDFYLFVPMDQLHEPLKVVRSTHYPQLNHLSHLPSG